MSFQCVVVTPEQQVLDEKITSAVVTAHDGERGFLTGRAPILLRLGVGPMTVTTVSNTRKLLFVDGGIAQMKDNVLTVITPRALAPDQINVEEARAELAEAEAKALSDPASNEARARQLARARGKLAVAGK
jgi:F-type H+-transporting ATPase subunit epsilon